MNRWPLAASLAVLTVAWFIVTYAVTYVASWSVATLLSQYDWWPNAAAALNLVIALGGFIAFFLLCRLVILRR